MFGRVREFARRHRGKLVFAGVAGTAAYFAAQYAHRKFLEWQHNATKDFFQQTKKQMHFDATQSRCADKTAALCVALVARTKERFNPDDIIAEIRAAAGSASSSDKLPLWDKLKTCSICRAFVAIYGGAMLSVLAFAQLNILGGYLFVQLNENEENLDALLGTEEQEAYLASLTTFLESGLDEFCGEVERVVREHASGIALKDQLTFERVNSLTYSIKNELDAMLQSKFCDLMYPINQDDIATAIVVETRAVFENPDVFSLLRHLTQMGTNDLLDKIARDWIEKSKPEMPKSEQPDLSAEMNANVIPQLPMFHETSIPFVKSLPFYSLFSPGNVLKDMMNSEQLKSFSASVYETFSVAAVRI